MTQWTYGIQTTLLGIALEESGFDEYLGVVASACALIPGCALAIVASRQPRSTHMTIRAAWSNSIDGVDSLVHSTVDLRLDTTDPAQSRATMIDIDQTSERSAFRYLCSVARLDRAVALPIFEGERLAGLVVACLSQGTRPVELDLPALDSARRITELGWVLRRSRSTLEKLQSPRAYDADAFARVLSVLPLGAVLVDGDLKVVQANRTFLELVGSHLFELRGQYLPDLFAESATRLEDLGSTLRYGTARLARKPRSVLRADGTERRVFVSVSPVGDEGELRELRLVLVEDVEEVFDDLARLHLHEEWVRGALQDAPIGLLICRPDGDVTSYSGGLAQELRARAEGARNVFTWLGTQGVRATTRRQLQRRDHFEFFLDWNERNLLVQSFRIDIDDEGANFRAIVILFVDVTETEQARLLAKRESQRNRSLTELSRAAIERIDEDSWRTLLTTESGRALPGAVVTFSDLSIEPDGGTTRDSAQLAHRLPVSDGTKVVGEIQLEAPYVPLEDDLRFLEAIAAIASIRIQTTAYERELERLSHVDRQFETWNRRCFLEHIDEWNLGVEAPPPGLALIRITNARDLHDQIGIETTNEAVRMWLVRIGELLPRGSELFALSYDEFAITLPSEWEVSHDALDALLGSLSNASSSLVDHAGIGIMLRTKMAGLVIDHDEPLGYQSLYSTLDLAIRRIGRNGDWNSQPIRHQADALARQEALEILTRYYYGPKSDTVFEPAIDLSSMRPVLYEAKSPLRELASLPPEIGSPVDALLSSGLVALAEENELNLAIGFVSTLEIPVSLVTINASPRSLLNGTLRTLCREVERPKGLPLGFEISERLLVDIPVTRLADEVAAIESMGGKVILDEVGRGFSSFVLLRDVRFHAIKLSRSLYGSIEEQGGALTAVLVDLARDLGIDAIATGVYTPELSRRLVELGATIQQGLAVTAAYEQANH